MKIECKAIQNMKKESANELFDFYAGYNNNIYVASRDMESKFNSAVKEGVDFTKVKDKVKLLTHSAYAVYAGKVGSVVNNFTILQDMLVYNTLADSKNILKGIFNPEYIEIGSVEKVESGKRYAIDGTSPVFFDIPMITSQGYRTSAVMVHVRIVNTKFIETLESLDINALEEIDMKVLAQDFSIVGRLSELAIDAAKDTTLETVEADKWLNKRFFTTAGAWLKTKGGKWTLAKDSMSEMIKSRASRSNQKAVYEITPDVDNKSFNRKYGDKTKVNTASCVDRKTLLNASTAFMNSENGYSYLLDNAAESDLLLKAIQVKNSYRAIDAKGNEDKKAPTIVKEVNALCNIYKQLSYSLSLTDVDGLDEEAIADLNYNNKLKKEKVAKSIRNTLVRVHELSNVKWSHICYMVIAYFLEGNSKGMITNDEDVKALIPQEYAILYSGKAYNEIKQRVTILNDELEERIEDEDEQDIKVKFVNGIGYDEDGIEIAKTKYSYNVEEAVLRYDEVTDEYYSVYIERFNTPTVDPEIPFAIRITTSSKEVNGNKVDYAVFYAKDFLGQELEFMTARAKLNKFNQKQINSFTKKIDIRENVVAKVVEDENGNPTKQLAAQFTIQPYTALALCNKRLVKMYSNKAVSELKDIMQDESKPLAGKIVINDTMFISNKNSTSDSTKSFLLAFVTAK